MGKSRNEKILENILGAENELEEPRSRIEALLLELLELVRSMQVTATSDGEGNVEVSLTQGDSSEA